MNRTDRLYALVEELRARAPRTMRAADLSERFEVSVRTVERDLFALQQAGVPIWAKPGPNGGYTLDPRRTLPPLNLSAAEATAVAVALAATASAPMADAGRSAMRKLLAVMSSPDREAAEKLASRVRVTSVRAPRATPAITKTIEEAVLRTEIVEIDYEDRNGVRTTRRVEAHGLAGNPGGWYLVGWCGLRDGSRMFRLDRVRDARPTGERVAARDVAELMSDGPESRAVLETER